MEVGDRLNPQRSYRKGFALKGLHQHIIKTNNPSTIGPGELLTIRFPDLKESRKHLMCCTFAQEVGSGKPSNLTLQSDCIGQFKTTGGKMKSDTDSQERQRTIISRSTVECMPPSLPPKKKFMEFYF